MGTNTVNFILDLITLILPLPYVQKLQVRRSQKLVVFGMFTLGGLYVKRHRSFAGNLLLTPPSIVAVSVILLVVCYRLDNNSPDVTWTITPLVLWAGTEINLGVVSACLPCLRPIFLLVTKGSARPDREKDVPQFDDTYALRDRTAGTVGTVGSRGRNVIAFTDIMAEEDGRHMVDKPGSSEDPMDHGSSGGDSEELRPPQDKVVVREDIYVNYSNA